MTKAELIKALAQSRNKTIREATLDVDAILNTIRDAVANGDKVTLTGFGTFSVKEQAEKQCRNPKTGEMQTVPAHKKVHFKAGKDFKEAVNK